MTTLTFKHNGIFGFHEETTLRAGDLGEDARVVFSQGHCHSLALALQGIVGGDLVAVVDDDGINHIALTLDGETYIDIAGRHSASELLANSGPFGFRIRPTDREEIEDEAGCTLFPLEEEKSRSFALALARAEGLEIVCTGAIYDDGVITHDGDTCPTHEAVALAV